MNTEGAQTLLRQIFNDYVQPELDRRRTNGDQVDNEIWAAQVVLDPERNEPPVRLNREVRLLAQPIGSDLVADYVELRDKGCRDFASVRLASEAKQLRHMSCCQIGLTAHWQVLFNLGVAGNDSPAEDEHISVDTGFHLPELSEWESLYAEHMRIVELVLAVNSQTPHAPIETVMAVALQRSRHLLEGYLPLIQSRNLTASSALIRMQIDSVMRVNACFLVDDPMTLWECLKKGSSWSTITLQDGSRLTDKYLHEQLSKNFDWATSVYNQMSGYIHLSRPHLESTVEGEDFLGMVIHQDAAGSRVTDMEVGENCRLFVKATKALFTLCEDYSKRRFS